MLTVFDPVTKKIPIPIPVPNINLAAPAAGRAPTMPSKLEFAEGGGGARSRRCRSTVRSACMFGANDAISGSGSLDVLRYGQPLRSRMLVGVRGAGLAYDGLYYVNSVTHNLKRGEYKQSFNLSRDGLISNTPVVIP